MSENAKPKSRRPWTTPQLLVIRAGAAEAKDNAGNDDGGKGVTDKS